MGGAEWAIGVMLAALVTVLVGCLWLLKGDRE